MRVTSASAGDSVFPGRSGQLLFTQKACTPSCDKHFAAMNADGSSFHLLRPYGNWAGYTPSPDGRYVLIHGGSSHFGETPTVVRYLRPEGGAIRTIISAALSNRTGLSVGNAGWLPDGKRIAFIANKGAHTGIYTIGIDGSKLRKVRVFADPGGRRGNSDFEFSSFAPAPDGRRYAFSRGIGLSRSLWVMNANGSGLRRISTRCWLTITDWSPDSKRLLIVAGDQTPADPECLNESGLETVSATTGKATRLVTEKRVDTGPQDGYGTSAPYGGFSPDGKRIVFVVDRSRCGGANTIMVMNADGTGVRTVRQGPGEIVNRQCHHTDYGAPVWRSVRR
jgi:dipeptidyl aminopeptidase/acylaminoacyl peptidase